MSFSAMNGQLAGRFQLPADFAGSEDEKKRIAELIGEDDVDKPVR